MLARAAGGLARGEAGRVSAQALAFAGACAAVLGAWEALGAAARAGAADRLRRVVAPLRRADGRGPTRPERLRLAALAVASAASGGWLVGGTALALLAAAGAPAAITVAARWRAARWSAALEDQAAEVARALADAVAAGHAVRGALAAAAPGLDGAAGRELRLAARALALGDRTEAVLERLRRRAGSRAWDTLVAALLLQRDAGGDLVGLLRRLAGALEAAERARRDARTATAQARFSAWLVAGMPLAAAAVAELASPGLMLGLLAHPVSLPLVVVAALLQGAGLLAIRRLAR